ncbi:MAG: tryptophan-rich sensory protein [Acidobacteria bacterium]|nr:tryptophan-rich sensory protein [Acidobacteriota bacterium]NIM61766.1 tryptophan-rich sensory protein [Acidobacteriota bacterium]NIO60010.1 tryptophan-rich sensory protein [Acidobacteriota bacterium]NIQ29202.1 tryptophan-rich sensory protein [Acidobacteriota bacterium]NIQ83776.1 tryptophan-rich sensory protein [Acidobacteriota bacterium]
MHRLIPLFVAVGVCMLVGVSGSVVTASSVREWYPGLAKPSWTPPAFLFGPVWSALYVMMGASAWLVWLAEDSAGRTRALVLFGLQLVLNALWSLIFFGLRSPGWAFVEIVALWVAIVATMGAFLKIRPIASALLVPYVLWVSFAAALNWTIWSLNR